jgi:hypothetical protein
MAGLSLALVVLVNAQSVTPAHLSEWRKEGLKGVAVILDNDSRAACQAVSKAGFELYGWIEVGRNPAMADAHPEWMGSIGMHTDWQQRFPGSRLPKSNEVAKAYPWVPITGEKAFDAHVARIKDLLRELPTNFAGVFLNDVQGPPSSCGCGNLQCRWAVDYHVPATAKQLSRDDAAARFVAEVQRLIPGKTIVPVWTTECEEQDLAKHKDSTGYCGTVGCATGSCPKQFSTQWNALRKAHSGPIALLTLNQEFGRPSQWIEDSLNYVGNRIERKDCWLVIEDGKEKRQIAAALSPARIVVTRVRLDQSYTPRIMLAERHGE